MPKINTANNLGKHLQQICNILIMKNKRYVNINSLHEQQFFAQFQITAIKIIVVIVQYLNCYIELGEMS